MKHERKIGGDLYTFSTGRSFDPNGGIIGLSPELEVYEGYDNGLHLHDKDGDVDIEELTPAERRELAEYMIEQWKRFADATARK